MAYARNVFAEVPPNPWFSTWEEHDKHMEDNGQEPLPKESATEGQLDLGTADYKEA